MISDKSSESLVSPCFFIDIVAFNVEFSTRPMPLSHRSGYKEDSASADFRVSIFGFRTPSFAFIAVIAADGFEVGGESGDGDAEGHGGACANSWPSIHTRLEYVKGGAERGHGHESGFEVCR